MTAKYIKVVHTYYGCDSGCCGHTAMVMDEKDSMVDSEFEFAHMDKETTKEQFWDGIASNLKNEYKVEVDYSKCEYEEI